MKLTKRNLNDEQVERKSEYLEDLKRQKLRLEIDIPVVESQIESKRDLKTISPLNIGNLRKSNQVWKMQLENELPLHDLKAQLRDMKRRLETTNNNIRVLTKQVNYPQKKCLKILQQNSKKDLNIVFYFYCICLYNRQVLSHII